MTAPDVGDASAQRSGRRALVVAVLVLALAGAAAGVWWVLDGRGDDEVADADREADDPEPVELGEGDEVPDRAALEALDEQLGEPLTYEDDPEQAQQAAVLLAGLGDDADVAAATAPATLDDLEARGTGVDQALPDGAVVEPLPETWVRRGNLGAMVVEVTLDGAQTPDQFVVWMIRDADGAWAISLTEAVDDAEPAP